MQHYPTGDKLRRYQALRTDFQESNRFAEAGLMADSLSYGVDCEFLICMHHFRFGAIGCDSVDWVGR